MKWRTLYLRVSAEMGATKAEGTEGGRLSGSRELTQKTEVRRNNNNDIERFVGYINIGRNETAERMGRAGELRETGACALLSAGTRSFGRELSRCVNLEQLLHDIPPSRSSRPGESRSGGRPVFGSVQGLLRS